MHEALEGSAYSVKASGPWFLIPDHMVSLDVPVDTLRAKTEAHRRIANLPEARPIADRTPAGAPRRLLVPSVFLSPHQPQGLMNRLMGVSSARPTVMRPSSTTPNGSTSTAPTAAPTSPSAPARCAGAAASKALIAEVALPAIFDRLPRLRLAPGAEVRFGGWAFRRPPALPLHWDPDAGRPPCSRDGDKRRMAYDLRRQVSAETFGRCGTCLRPDRPGAGDGDDGSIRTKQTSALAAHTSLRSSDR